MEWKKYDELYEVSEYGDVKNLKNDKILKVRITPEGYVHYSLHGKNKKIHRIVAKLFVPNKMNLPCCNHIDGNKLNNHYSNIEWCTQGHNLKESYRLGLTKGPSKTYRAYKNGVLVGEYQSGYACARALDIGLSTPSVSINLGLPMRGYTFDRD